METEKSLQYDSNWPPIGNTRSLHVFTRKEDTLIVDYLIETKQFDRLGGNEVWKTMSRSKKFNPAGRSYQGLRERFLKHIVKRLHLYSRVTPQIKARFLKQNPKALRDINAMKSTEDLKRDLEKGWSSEEEGEVIGENASDNATMANVLSQRKRLVDGLMENKTLTSTPLHQIRDEISSKEVKPEEPVPAASGEHLFSSQSVNEEDAVDKSNFEMSIQLSHICPSLLFVFDSNREDVNFSFRRLKAVEELREVSSTLQRLQTSLRDALEAHSNALSVQSLSCPRSSCKGIATYFGLWEELISYFDKIEKYQLRFDGCYVNFFLRVIEDILSTPLCCSKPPVELPKINARQLYEYLCCEFAEQFRENLKSLQRLMRFVRSACT